MQTGTAKFVLLNDNNLFSQLCGRIAATYPPVPPPRIATSHVIGISHALLYESNFNIIYDGLNHGLAYTLYMPLYSP